MSGDLFGRGEPIDVERIDIRRWALLGARERLAELAAEALDIYKAFPELRSHAIGFGKRTGGSTAAVNAAPPPRRTLSPDTRKRISDAQKARWAKYRSTQK